LIHIKTFVLSHLLEYNNKMASMFRVSVVASITSITTEKRAVVEYKHSDLTKKDKKIKR
jgi:hypothetical protein